MHDYWNIVTYLMVMFVISAISDEYFCSFVGVWDELFCSKPESIGSSMAVNFSIYFAFESFCIVSYRTVCKWPETFVLFWFFDSIAILIGCWETCMFQNISIVSVGLIYILCRYITAFVLCYDIILLKVTKNK